MANKIMMFRDTIAAIATPPGVGGISVIRISGPDAENIALQIFSPLPPHNFHSHHLYHGQIVSPETKELLDEVLLTLFRGPHSFTGEDTLEISCHGGALITQTLLEAVLRAGARPAAPGEFTKRAFLNNRLDLAQAEAVNDLIKAQTGKGLKAAFNRLQGGLSSQIQEIREELLDMVAAIEAALDFTAEEGMGETADDHILKINRVIDKITSLVATYKRGKIERLGFGVVIAGAPNVGKSSLLNRLLGGKRAIVSSTPGTTRDFIEETADMEGIPVRLTDTAGLRVPQDDIEKEGIAFLWEKADSADAIIFLLDASREITTDDRELLKKISGKKVLLVFNKSDLPPRADEKSLTGLLPEGLSPALRISAKYGEGIDILTAAIRKLAVNTEAGEAPSATIAHSHQKTSLENAKECLSRAASGLVNGMPAEIVALEIREALDFIGEIVGKTSNEDILNRIFSKFCIGK
ncbi:MAG: tRNA uridine-5-carboxymethylaminomethyl(34) synthesis GTPase MnmE [Syntrophales bacterium]|jgi:tRNA modification GTPase|nr:tRNA uridine-5-carboxymethylaminomethyl(34) synthesis GTPase MnmE [Syntrophales bacterium]